VPGFKSDADGSRGQYPKLGTWLSEKGVGAYIQMPHQVRDGYPRTIVDDLDTVINYALMHATTLCTTSAPAIYLVGSSAGAAVVGAFAYKWPEVKKLLLMAPVAAAVKEVHEGLPRFTGEIYVIAGEKDNIGIDSGPVMAKQFVYLATSAWPRELHVIPGCDHAFSSREHSKIASKAHLWAFAGDTSFPDPEGGIEL
jgi:pimeloyl-ACP methyl ester carboxylesterase